jgi:hypothetical protein
LTRNEPVICLAGQEHADAIVSRHLGVDLADRRSEIVGWRIPVGHLAWVDPHRKDLLRRGAYGRSERLRWYAYGSSSGRSSVESDQQSDSQRWLSRKRVQPC